MGMDKDQTGARSTVNVTVNTNHETESVSNGLATAGGVLGIIAFLLGWIPLAGIFFGWPLGVLAVVFGGIGLSKANKGYNGKGLAIAGLVFGILTIILKSIPGLNLL